MPYIPKAHEKYNLLPFCRENGGEVFSYSSEMEDQIRGMLPEGDSVIPYGYDNYEAFYARLDKYVSLYGTAGGKLSELGKKILEYKDNIKKRNIKENWSVVKYVGKSTGGPAGFTHGRYYCWPCYVEKPEYEGIIDDEGFTSNLAWVNKGKISQTLENGEATDFIESSGDWEIAEDPTGMAKRKLTEVV